MPILRGEKKEKRERKKEKRERKKIFTEIANTTWQHSLNGDILAKSQAVTETENTQGSCSSGPERAPCDRDGSFLLCSGQWDLGTFPVKTMVPRKDSFYQFALNAFGTLMFPN